MQEQTGSIKGNNNVQVVGGDHITTQKVIKKTEVIYDPNLYITDAQASEIQTRILKIAEELKGKYENPHAFAYSSFRKKFKITKYSLLPKEKFEEAIKWLDKQIAMNRPKLRKTDNDQYRKDTYRSLNARAKQLGIDIHEFANQELELKNPITSLKELSDTRLNKLYKKLFSIRR